jgi:hypothetical protein
MITLSGMALIYRFVPWRAARWVALALAGLWIANFILQKGGRGKIKVITSPVLQFSLVFYRGLNHAEWDILGDEAARGDYYVFLVPEVRPELKVVYRDAGSGTVVMQ